MAALLMNYLDNITPIRSGENGHSEYGWSNNIQERIVQFNFQLVRTKDTTSLKSILHGLLTELKHTSKTAVYETKAYLSVLYRMIGYTRDIIDGKGEYMLTYMMIHTWNQFYPELAHFALKCLVDIGDNHPYGSWKDIKYFCEYCVANGDEKDSHIIKYAVNLVNSQLKKDYTNLTSNGNISLVAKWIPREKSRFSWLYNMLATNYYSNFLETAKTNEQILKATLKCKTEYRKIISTLNKHLDTLQIKQCGDNWSEIDFNKVTSVSLSKQKNAFMNVTKSGTIRSNKLDRVTCSKNFENHVNKAVSGEVEMKGKRVGMADFTHQALQILSMNSNSSKLEKDLLNSQWRDNTKQNKKLGKMIPMVDVSGSMSGDPLNVAIALGIRIAENSIIGNRVMTFSNKPSWVNLEAYPDFVSKVDVLRRAEWGMNTNFYAALNLILDAIVANKMSAEDVQNMVLVILSDMQMDQAYSGDKNVLYDKITQLYSETGIKTVGVPYNPPHILFWNLRSTQGSPTLSSQSNTSMMSGFSPVVLNMFCEEGVESLQSCTPWSIINKSLDNTRYDIMRIL